jgi:hypothetical protein
MSAKQPVVKVQLHSAGAASHLHPTALKNARRGPRGLAALLLAQILPVLHPTVHNTHGGDPALHSSRRTAGVPTARTVRRGVEEGASPPSVRRRTFTTGCQRSIWASLAIAAAIVGVIVALHYHRIGLTLTHYDARAHLVVARRIVDSITPGWQQIGAVWLPLPHLLNFIPVQIDLFYRTGASAVAISIAAFAVATGAIASIVLTLTGSSMAALAAAAVFALNPNILYLQSTPMTEPLLIALTTLGVAMLVEWCRTTPAGVEFGPPGGHAAVRSGPPSAAIGWTFALACMTRYEAWPVTACALTAAAWALWRRGAPWASAWRLIADMAIYPAGAILAFVIISRIIIGEFFAADFFVPENKALNDFSIAAAEIGWGTRALSGPLLTWAGGIGAGALVASGLWRSRHAHALVAVSLAAAAAIPWLAFYKGHPFRIRYMVPLIAIEAVGAGFAAGMLRRGRAVVSLVVLAIVAFELRPLDRAAPMVVEAQWDSPNILARASVTACLDGPASGTKIMASMGSLGHHMQEAAAQGFAIRDFLHEGNGDIWLAALNSPRPYAEWILIEEKAEGGDMLARLARTRPTFLSGYSRVCEGAGLALYRRNALRVHRASTSSQR